MSKLVLIDRDGVINVEKEQGYVESPTELEIYPHALEAFALFKQHGFTCVVITNQSVVGRGRITLSQLDTIHDYLRKQVAVHDGKIAEVIACTDHPELATLRRKPGAGMLLEALANYNASAADTAMIGDAMTDLQAAHAAGCQRYLVGTGKGQATAAALGPELQPVRICANLLEAARIITASAQL